MPQKLSEQELASINGRYQAMDYTRAEAVRDVDRLLGHIGAVEAELANERRKVSVLSPLASDLQQVIWSTIPRGEYLGDDLVDVVRAELVKRAQRVLFLENALQSIWEKRGFKPEDGGLIADLAVEVARKALSINENEA